MYDEILTSDRLSRPLDDVAIYVLLHRISELTSVAFSSSYRCPPSVGRDIVDCVNTLHAIFARLDISSWNRASFAAPAAERAIHRIIKS